MNIDTIAFLAYVGEGLNITVKEIRDLLENRLGKKLTESLIQLK